MKKVFILFLFSFVLVLKSISQQNLVPNNSFENYNTYCHVLDSIVPWYNPTATTPDIIHDSCTGFNPPYLLLPYHGLSYAGIYLFQKGYNNSREYLSVPLITSLVSGKNYCVSLMWYRIFGSDYAVKNLGVLFSTNAINLNILTNIPQIPQLENNNGYLIDSANWNQIAFNYTAQGNENYLTIGNFRDDSQTDTIRLKYGFTSWDNAYYYIDDVSVVELINANAGKDTLVNYGDSTLLGGPAIYAAQYQWQPTQGLSCSTCPNPKASPASTTIYTVTVTQCSQITTDTVQISVNGTGINEMYKQSFKVYPNPAQGEFNLSIKNNLEASTKLCIYNSLGEKVFEQSNLKPENKIQFIEKPGIYFLRLVSKEGGVLSSIKLLSQ